MALAGTLSIGLASAQPAPAEGAPPPAAPGAPGQGGPGQRGGGRFDPAQMFERMDANKDGKLAKDELSGRMADSFDQLDANKDGSIDQAEMGQMRDRMRGQRDTAGLGGPGGDFQGRMSEMFKQRLGASDEEWGVIQPRLQKVMELQGQSRRGMGMMMFGGGAGGPVGPGARRGGDQGAPPAAQAMPEATALETAVEDQAQSNDQIQAKLTAYREARAKQEAELKAAREELRQVLSLRQESILVLSGMLD